MIDVLWCIPALPLLVSAILLALPRMREHLAGRIALGGLALSLLLSLAALPAEPGYRNFPWFRAGGEWLHIGWVLDPLSAIMLAMVSLVGSLVMLYSRTYMAGDGNAVRFFAHLSFFAAAMLGLVMANSLLLLFLCWELVGLASWLLIGFRSTRPEAVAAANKAFLMTRIGDLGLFLGMVWLSASTGSLLFFDEGAGVLEPDVLARLGTTPVLLGLSLSTGISLLAAWGAFGKSGQFPLHSWLPSAMEGPTPVSALIHAATMVAAGVFLLIRIHPLMSDASLEVVTWIGCLTLLLGSLTALAQTDIKRILAWSTVSQLGFMMLGLGVGGPGTALFHLLTHAFFKSLLFLGAGSVIRACGGVQDIRRMGGLARSMPLTFATCAVGMLALSGFPLVSGFWSKDAILHAALEDAPPAFAAALLGTFLTALYMTRQMVLVFLGTWRGDGKRPGESPAALTAPLLVLAILTLLVGFAGTPASPLIQDMLEEGRSFSFAPGALLETLPTMLLSSVLAPGAMVLGWFLWRDGGAGDPLASRWPGPHRLLGRGFHIDAVHRFLLVDPLRGLARIADSLENALVLLRTRCVAPLLGRIGNAARSLDERTIRRVLQVLCRLFEGGGGLLARLRDGNAQSYLIASCAAMALLLWMLLWMHRP